MQEAAFAQTLDAIYDAAVDYGRWPLALERLGGMFDCCVVALIERNMRSLQGRATASGIDLAGQREYFEIWGKRNVFVQRTKSWRPGAIEPDRQILPKAELLRSDYYNGFMKPRDMHSIMRLSLHVEGENQQAITLVRPRVAGEYEAADVERCRLFMPHLQRAARITRHFDEANLQRHAMAQVLEQNPSGVLLLDRGARVVFANRAARAIAASNDGVRLRRDRFELSDSRDDQALQRLVLGALHRFERIDTPPNLAPRGGVMRLPRPSGKPDLIAVVTALDGALASQAWGIESGPMAFVILTDPTAIAAPQDVLLRRLFGLSAAEARVALCLMQGDGLGQSAERLNLKLSTVRWHLASIFRKTGTSRQAELVRLLSSLPSAGA